MCVLDCSRGRTHRAGAREGGRLVTSRKRLDIVDFGEEINQSWREPLCPWHLDLTAFVSLRRPAFSTPDFRRPAHQPLIAQQQKEGTCLETVPRNPRDEAPAEEPAALWEPNQLEVRTFPRRFVPTPGLVSVAPPAGGNGEVSPMPDAQVNEKYVYYYTSYL